MSSLKFKVKSLKLLLFLDIDHSKLVLKKVPIANFQNPESPSLEDLREARFLLSVLFWYAVQIYTD